MSGYVVVVGTDGSENAAKAVDVAAEMAARSGGKVVLVHVFEPLAHLQEMDKGETFADLADQARETLNGEWAQPVRDAGVTVEAKLVHGSPAEAVLDVADEVGADFVVVGARGLGRLKMLMLGSTSSKMVQASRRPVVVIPAG